MRKLPVGHLVRLCIIAALLVSAALLARASGYFRGGIASRLSGTEGTGAPRDLVSEFAAGEMVQAVSPRTVLVRMPDGETTATAWGGEETAAGARCFTAILGEALGSAGSPEPLDESSFRAAVDAGGVYFEFFCPMPLDALAVWLGSDGQGAAAVSARMIFLSLAEQTVTVCFRASDGAFRRCATAAVSETLAARMQEFQGRAARFAFEDDTLSAPDPYAVIFSELPTVTAAASAPVRDAGNPAALLRAAGMNSYVTTSYVEADGTHVFIDEGRTLRFGTAGTVRFRTDIAAGERQTGEGLAAAVSYASAVALHGAADYLGAATLRVMDILTDGADRYIVSFGYCLNGIPVHLSAGDAARIEIRSGQLVQFELKLRTYAFTDGAEELLPMPMAAAIAAEDGAAPELVYADSGERVSCTWVKAG